MLELASGENRPGVDIQIPVSKFQALGGTVGRRIRWPSSAGCRHPAQFRRRQMEVLRAHLGEDGAFRIPFVLDGDYVLSVPATTEGQSHTAHAYKDADSPINVDGDMTGMAIMLPDAQTPYPKHSP